MNRRLYKKRSSKAGLPPGSLVPVGDIQEGPTQITLIEYHEDYFDERKIHKLNECLPLKESPIVSWINIDSVHDPVLLEEFGKAFSLHPLTMEDILNTDQRPKIENLDNVLYIVLKSFSFDKTLRQVKMEQVSLIVGPNFVLSFLEKIGDEFDPIREQLKANHSRLRKLGSDYLAYSLIDIVVDQYFVVLEKLGECLEDLELQLTVSSDAKILGEIHTLRRELILLRKAVWPFREVVNALLRLDSPLIHETTQPYLRDVYDHTIQVIDTVETYRDILSGLQDLYLSVLSNRINEVMKVLTIISAIFIPVTFIAGVYGMNFKYMPELDSPYGYVTVVGLMLSVVIIEIIYFKKKKWF